MKSKIKYIYFFRGSLTTHIHFYKCWVEAARKNNLNMEMVTILNPVTYIKQHKLVRKYRTNYFHILFGFPGRLNFLLIFLYFSCHCIFNDKVIIYLKKQPTYIFDKLKRIFPNKLKYAIELEGDPDSEKDYLLKHPYKEGFYKNDIKKLEIAGHELEGQIQNSDHIFVVTEKFKDVIIQRFPNLNLEHKVTVLPIGFNKEEVYFSIDARNEYRRKLELENKFIITYIGNAYYSWQNVYRTIEIYKLIKNRLAENAFLLLLIRKEDHNLIEEFIKDLNISREEYILTQVDHKEIFKYLSASDIGVLLRHKHLMNEVVTSGKIVDYLAAGLPVLTTNVIAKYPRDIIKYGFGIILNNMDDNDEIIKKVPFILECDNRKRKEISNWAVNRFSSDAYAQNYVNALIMLSEN